VSAVTAVTCPESEEAAQPTGNFLSSLFFSLSPCPGLSLLCQADWVGPGRKGRAAAIEHGPSPILLMAHGSWLMAHLQKALGGNQPG
jgi:hypothetical protein